jgi:3-oxoacyl-[acyl-carrier-protein] synthase-3
LLFITLLFANFANAELKTNASMNIIITGTGSYTPGAIVSNSSFNSSCFYDPNGHALTGRVETIIEKFREITGIEERRYVKPTEDLSDIAAVAAVRAIIDAKLDAEKIDVIIMAHNFGNVATGSTQTNLLPSIASRVKHILGISNPHCVAFDIVCGCPGWLQAMILARQYIMSLEAKCVLVVGGDTLSRVTDAHDRDSMIYGDGAGAAVVEGLSNHRSEGIITTCSQTYSETEAFYLRFGESNKKNGTGTRYIKMDGKKIYEFALKNVPAAMKLCLDKSGIEIGRLKMIFLHQANEKMDEAILKRFYKLFTINQPPAAIMPMNINKFGNTSVASVPMLLDQVLKKKCQGYQLEQGDVIMMASVGAGMNINAIIYSV